MPDEATDVTDLSRVRLHSSNGVGGFVLRAHQIRERQKLCAFVLAMLIALTGWAIPTTPAFADLSPEFSNATASANVDPPIQLAEANLPPGVGSLNDYVREGNGNDGGSRTAVPPQAYRPQAVPPQGYYPQGAPSQEWNNPYADPNAERSALIGAAVVGALAVGLWAWQQHEMHQAQHRARRRFSHRRAFD
jgi:hypothetical protein